MLGKHYGQDLVKAGTYLGITNGEFIPIPEEGGYLPGSPQTGYLKVPLPIMMVLGPLLGLAFILFLPAAGMFVLANFAIALAKHKTIEGVAIARGTAIQMAAPRRQPGISYLNERGSVRGAASTTGRRHREASEVGSLIEQLEREINERRSLGEK